MCLVKLIYYIDSLCDSLNDSLSLIYYLIHCDSSFDSLNDSLNINLYNPVYLTDSLSNVLLDSLYNSLNDSLTTSLSDSLPTVFVSLPDGENSREPRRVIQNHLGRTEPGLPAGQPCSA